MSETIRCHIKDRTVDFHGEKNIHFTLDTKFCMVSPNICGLASGTLVAKIS